jgi:hypothetical protein
MIYLRAVSFFSWCQAPGGNCQIVRAVPTEQLFDFVTYQEIAVNIFRHAGHSFRGMPAAWQGPAYPLALGYVYRLAGNSDVLTGKFFNIILSILTLVALYFLLDSRKSAGICQAGIFAPQRNIFHGCLGYQKLGHERCPVHAGSAGRRFLQEKPQLFPFPQRCANLPFVILRTFIYAGQYLSRCPGNLKERAKPSGSHPHPHHQPGLLYTHHLCLRRTGQVQLPRTPFAHLRGRCQTPG